MPRYEISYFESYENIFVVDAADEDEALEKVRDGSAKLVSREQIDGLMDRDIDIYKLDKYDDHEPERH